MNRIWRRMNSLMGLLSNSKVLVFLVFITILTLYNLYYGLHEMMMTESLTYENFDWPLNVDLGEVKDLSHLTPLYTFNGINLMENFKLREGIFDGIIAIKTSLYNFKNRRVLRETWIRDLKETKIEYLFVIASQEYENSTISDKLYAESHQYNDMIQFPFVDNYYNNTLKAVETYYFLRNNYVNNPRRKSKFFVFVDDDYLVNVPSLSMLLLELSIFPRELNYFCLGYVFRKARPFRGYYSKWNTNLEEYRWSHWPPYPTAGLYIMNDKLLERVADIAPYVKMIRFDDVYLGIILYRLKIRPIHDERFAHKKPILHKYKNYFGIHMNNNLADIVNGYYSLKKD